ncbi:MAG: UDP-N-acetylmuramate dehydrogenase [Clostridia bacterium]|nr:UDP-N-acetylmuramate dehydrogenase [Clostridia bacterium]
MICRAEDVIKNAGVKYLRDFDVAGISTVGVRSLAAFLAAPESGEELVRLLRGLHAEGIDYRVVGGMSNIMPSSEYYRGVLINTRKINRNYVAENTLHAECGVRLSTVVLTLKKNGLGGMAQLYHIPGTVGGSVRGNAGAHGIEISDVLQSALVYIPSRDEVLRLSNSEMQFGYRTSRIKTEGTVLSAVIAATPCDADKTDAEIEYYRNLRKSQPRGVRTLGSTFKRLNGKSAGWYIDRCGMKGFSVGGATVSELHAGFIVNRGDATVSDVLCLIDTVKERVLSRFGVLLEEEIDYL